MSFETNSDRLVASDESGEIRIWSLETTARAPLRTIQAGMKMGRVGMDASGSTLVGAQGLTLATSAVAALWDLDGPPDADPLVLRNGDATAFNAMAMDRGALWLATAHNEIGVVLWAPGHRYARTIRGQSPPYIDVEFTPDGNWLASSSDEGAVRLWPLSASVAPRRRTLLEEKGALILQMAVEPTGRNVLAVSRFDGRAFLIPFDGGEPRLLPSSSPGRRYAPAFSADGSLAAVSTIRGPRGALIEVFDLRSGGVEALDPRIGDEDCGWGTGFEGHVQDARFTSDGRLLTAGATGLRLWNLEEGTSTLLRPCQRGTRTSWGTLGASPADRFLLGEIDLEQRSSVTIFFDLRQNTSRELTSHGNRVTVVALDPKGEIAVTGDYDGVVRVGPVTDEEPHLLYGHTLEVSSVAVSPNGQWIASGSQDGTIRLWPMPEGRPFHTLPYEEILERLRSFTNLRVFPDERTDTGYRVEAGPFPGWAKHPEP